MTSASYEVSLPAFAGPLDLLLHLIEAAEVDIYDISIAAITSQYLAYLRAAQSLELDVSIEFLVMAATLMLIKARALVPREDVSLGRDTDEGFAELDTREALIQRLLEYRRFKEVARQLAGFEESASRLFSREPSIPVLDKSELPLPPSLTAADLYDAFQKVLLAQREAAEPFRRIPREEINVGEAMRSILDRMARHGASGAPLLFRELFEGCATRAELIAAFLGLLELVRLGRLGVQQGEAVIEITLRPISAAHSVSAAEGDSQR